MSEPSNIHLSSPISQIAKLRNFDEISEPNLENGNLLNDLVIESKLNQISSDCILNLSSLPNEDLTKVLEHLKKDLSEVQGENANVESEIEELSLRCLDDSVKFESELEKLSCLSELIESKIHEKAKEDMQMDVPLRADDQADVSNKHDSMFKMLELSLQIEKKTTTLKSMLEVDSILKRFEAVEKIEDALTGLRVIAIEENSITLSLNTHIPYLDNVLHRQNIEDPLEPLELNHELILETVDGTLELKKVEIFPNDVYIFDIIDDAKSFRKLYPMISVIETESSLEWFMRRVQERIALSSLRRFVVKNANKSSRSFEYLDRDEVIIAHMVGGVDAFIKLPQGWPISEMALELISLKSTIQNSVEISLSFLFKIVEMANSLNVNVRHNISNFMDRIDEIIMQQMRVELNPPRGTITTM